MRNAVWFVAALFAFVGNGVFAPDAGAQIIIIGGCTDYENSRPDPGLGSCAYTGGGCRECAVVIIVYNEQEHMCVSGPDGTESCRPAGDVVGAELVAGLRELSDPADLFGARENVATPASDVLLARRCKPSSLFEAFDPRRHPAPASPGMYAAPKELARPPVLARASVAPAL